MVQKSSFIRQQSSNKGIAPSIRRPAPRPEKNIAFLLLLLSTPPGIVRSSPLELIWPRGFPITGVRSADITHQALQVPDLPYLTHYKGRFHFGLNQIGRYTPPHLLTYHFDDARANLVLRERNVMLLRKVVALVSIFPNVREMPVPEIASIEELSVFRRKLKPPQK